MNPKEIKNMIDFISKSGLAEVNIKTEEFKISVKRNAKGEVTVAPPLASAPVAAPAAIPSPTPPSAPVVEEEANNYIEIKSPMIGTFYRASNPDDPEFVAVGDTVSIGKKVCIIEAMKLFNEIESEVSGTIVKILAENASPVEYDQPLFLVDPS